MQSPADISALKSVVLVLALESSTIIYIQYIYPRISLLCVYIIYIYVSLGSLGVRGFPICAGEASQHSKTLTLFFLPVSCPNPSATAGLLHLYMRVL